jgi:uncharacterized protein with beta-barrel porin domain
MPALAQMEPTVTPGAQLPDEFAFPAGQTFSSGVTSTGSPTATASVIDINSGTILQGVPGEEHEDEETVTLAAEGVAPAVEDEEPTGPSSVTLSNAGNVTVAASAIASNTDGQAIANANVLDAVSQYVAGPFPLVTATATNTGTLTVGSTATATGTTAPGEGDSFGARASSILVGGFHQEAALEENTDGTATATSTNSGTFTAFSRATASAVDDADALAVLQEAIYIRSGANGASDAATVTTLTNSGLLDFSATAAGTSAAGDATALAEAGGGEHGLVHLRSRTNGRGVDTSDVLMVNTASGDMLVNVAATATAAGVATATATGGDAFSTEETLKGGGLVIKAQSSGADDGDITAVLENAGEIRFNYVAAANSTGTPTDGEEETAPTLGANATAGGNGAIDMVIEAGGPSSFVGRTGLASLTNASGGVIAINASATANSAGDSRASAVLGASVYQQGEITGVATLNFANAGTFSTTTNALATGAAATAESRAEGVRQTMIAIGGANAGFANSGTFTVTASANANGSDSGTATGQAVGYTVIAEPIALTVANSGTMTVNATSTSTGGAAASATGMSLLANIDPTTLPPESGGNGGGGNGGGGGEEEEVEDPWETWTNRISGTVSNSGTLSVTATATGATADEGINANATATGIEFVSAVNTATLSNSGTIIATAITNGGDSRATGILVSDFVVSPILPGETDRMTIANSGGTIIARESVDGGTTFQRGTAIDVRFAPNPVDINFTGTSNVYGDISIGADDTITVASGITTFDGIINPEPEMVETAGNALAAGPIGSLVGSLTVANGATLYLVDQPNDNPNYDGPAGVNVDSFTLASGSTLQLQMPSSTLAPEAQAAFPYVNANAVTLTGANLVLVMNTPNGLFDDAYVFNDVIDGETRTGQFASVTTNTGSVLLAPAAVYDANANVDITLTRVAFDAVAGLTPNQAAVGGALQAVYTPTQDGDYGKLLANLFLISDPAVYGDAMNQLSGAQYAGHMQAVRNNALQVSTLVADQIDCAVTKGEVAACRDQDGGLRLWALGGIQDARVKSDGNGIGHRSDGSHALLGVDYTVSNFTIGAFGGYREVSSDFDLYGGEVNSDGFQIGMLAGYDSGDFYLRANGSYSSLNGDAARTVGVLTTAGAITGDPDFRVTSFYAEAGGRFELGESWITPFVGLEYTKVKMKGFTETGVSGANLDFDSQSESDTAFLAGVKWAGKLGIVVPEAKIAYRHDDNAAFATTQRFADAPGTALFTSASPQSDKDTVMAGFSLAALFNEKVTGRIGYQGRFGSGLRDNAFYGTLVISFGGK